jgi:hypothetical protein
VGLQDSAAWLGCDEVPGDGAAAPGRRFPTRYRARRLGGHLNVLGWARGRVVDLHSAGGGDAADSDAIAEPDVSSRSRRDRQAVDTTGVKHSNNACR